MNAWQRVPSPPPVIACRIPRPAESSPNALALGCWLGIAVAGLVLLPAGSAIRSLWLAPWCEEVVWRWGLQAPLARRVGAGAAIALSALAFGLAHLLFARDAADAWRAAATALPAAWMGLVFARSGRITPCVAWHAAFNFAWLAAHGP
ncbi:lysostaphin resistance A-like protein [Ideonella sp. YS5]|uniref:CPBP family intramembrane glutamic endopeptidase n=1 Tax=Ideonella sp. YS5 TaxID=3453714 RepID=UPI003EEFEBA2